MDINLRKATLNDIDKIAKVHIDSWRAVYRGYMSDTVLDNLSLDKRTCLWRERLNAGVNVWVAEINNNIIGFTSLRSSRDKGDDPNKVAEISTIYLLPEYWRKGLGKRLCQIIFDEAIKKGFTEIILWVLESNIQASEFYESQGFSLTGDVQTDRSGCEDLRAVRYKKIF